MSQEAGEYIPHIFDLHEDYPTLVEGAGKNMRHNTFGGVTVGGIEYASQASIEGFRKGNFKIVFGNIFPLIIEDGETTPPQEFSPKFRHQYEAGERVLKENTDELQPITTQEALSQVMASDKIGIVRSVEGLYGLSPQNEKIGGRSWQEELDEVIAKGIRSVGIMWNEDSSIGTGTSEKNEDPIQDTGLTPFGREVVSYLARHGIIIDVSHASRRTSLGVLSVLKELDEQGIVHPSAIATHSGMKAVTNHPRNLPDEVVEGIFSQGGIVGLPVFSLFVGGNDVAAVLSHMDHVRQTWGDEGLKHLAIGTDFDGMYYPEHPIKGLEDASVLGKNLAAAMREKEYSEEEIEDIFGGNAMRFLQQNLPRQ